MYIKKLTTVICFFWPYVYYLDCKKTYFPRRDHVYLAVLVIKFRVFASSPLVMSATDDQPLAWDLSPLDKMATDGQPLAWDL